MVVFHLVEVRKRDAQLFGKGLLRQAKAAEQTALTLLETRTTDFNTAINEAEDRHKTLKRLRAGNNNASDVPGGVLQRNNIHIAVCQPGTTGAGLQALRSSPATAKGKAKFILATDGQTLEAEDLTAGETIAWRVSAAEA